MIEEVRMRMRNLQLAAFTLAMCAEDLEREGARYHSRWIPQIEQIVRYADALRQTIDALAKQAGVG